MEGSNRYLIEANNIKEIRKLLKILKEKSNIRWESGEQLDDENILNSIEDENGLVYLVIRGNTMFWLDEEGYFEAPEEFMLFDLYDVNSFINKIANNMEKKLEIKNLAIIASDDKYGEKLLNFLEEFTAVKFNSGDTLTSKAMAELIKEHKDRHPKNNLIFTINNNKMYIDVYYKENLPIYKTFIGGATIYDSIREFLLCKDDWIKE